MNKKEIKKLLKNFPKVFYKTRMWGKTTKLVKMSAKTGLPIVVAHKFQVSHILDRAKNLGLEIPTPITAKNCMDGGHDFKEVLVDDIDYVMMELLGVEIKALSLTNMKKHLNKEYNR